MPWGEKTAFSRRTDTAVEEFRVISSLNLDSLAIALSVSVINISLRWERQRFLEREAVMKTPDEF